MKTNFETFRNSLILILVGGSAVTSAASSGMCFKKNRFHSISALNLDIPLSTFNKGVDAALKFGSNVIAKNLAGKNYGTVQNDCLTAHNQYRMLVGASPLTWSSSAQNVAQNWANKLANSGAFEHSHTPGYGENLYRESGMSNSCNLAVVSWFDEHPIYASNSAIGSGNFEGYGHYTQLIWPATRQVGCAQATGSTGVTTVCEYVPPGNVAGTGVAKNVAQK